MNDRSLPLFDDPEAHRLQAGPARAKSEAHVIDAHLAAARRLSRRMARLKERSPEQFAVGAKICRHLIAMLKDSAPKDAGQQPH